ncbi:MAG: beta-lactamase family protein [Gemmatimonadetes bacterium]|nr:beta-lactamase family protein [Gemmatimonadota bacterium]
MIAPSAAYIAASSILLLVGAPSPPDTLDFARKAALTDSLFSDLATDGSPGCAVGVVQDGELVFGKGYGHGNLDYDVPLNTRSSFYLASVSKQFIGAAVGLLVLDGVLDLDGDVRDIVPELPDYGSRITSRHLLHHTSGLRDYLTLFTIAGQSFQDFFDNQDALELIARQKALNFEPGSEFLYSNSGYVLLAEIIERVTGKSLDAFTQARLFQPLGMKDTHWGEDVARVVPGRAVSYQIQDGTAQRFIWNFHAKGDGNLHSTVEDLARWDALFYRTDEPWAYLTDLLYTKGTLNDGSEIPYALRLSHGSYEDRPFISHGGGMLGYRTLIQRFPDNRFTSIVLCNLGSANPGLFGRQLSEVWLLERKPTGAPEPATTENAGADEAPEPAWDPGADELAAYEGTFYSAELDASHAVYVEDGVLRLGDAAGESMELQPRERDVFNRGVGTTFVFVREGGVVTGFTLDAGRVRGLFFQREDTH